VPEDKPQVPKASRTRLLRPEDVLPHRAPLLLVDEVLEVEPGVSAKGYWDLGGPEGHYFDGHFPGRPTLPGVLMVEALAQLGAYAVLSDERYADRLPLFGGIDKARFKRQVLPGDRLELEVSIGRMSARAGTGHGIASVAGAKACEVDLLFVLAPRG
jgi:3-hydroxyacyl-[acyl-carrier-protein] dehydratase